ncbi:SH3 domain-containing protein [Pseudomonas sp. PCH446]
MTIASWKTARGEFSEKRRRGTVGYVSISVLESLGENQYRFKGNGELNVRAQASGQSPVIAKLPTGTEMTVSGEGEFRKLEHIIQYVHFNSLQGAREPLNPGQVVVLDQPVPIKAGDLIGHIGCYQKCYAEEPEEKLHLEVFSGEGVDDFIEASRAWAERLPATDKTWLKLVKGTVVVPHREHYSAATRPIFSDDGPLSGADLLIPKSLLDSLPAERKIAVPQGPGVPKAYNWYRLDGLLNDADKNVLDGWVREEVGVTLGSVPGRGKVTTSSSPTTPLGTCWPSFS